jgi:uncharacterized damage-inducible protein DinB
MRKVQLSLMALALTALALVSFKAVNETPAGPKMAAMIADWERAKAFTQEYLEAANEEVISFKPSPDMRSFGEQMLHLAESNYGFASAASGKANPIAFGQLQKAAGDYNTKEALSKVVADSYDFVISALKEFDESKLGEPIKIFGRFELTRETAFSKAFEHQTHHRGQTTVYLRLKGIKPPNEKLF